MNQKPAQHAPVHSRILIHTPLLFLHDDSILQGEPGTQVAWPYLTPLLWGSGNQSHSSTLQQATGLPGPPFADTEVQKVPALIT